MIEDRQHNCPWRTANAENIAAMMRAEDVLADILRGRPMTPSDEAIMKDIVEGALNSLRLAIHKAQFVSTES